MPALPVKLTQPDWPGRRIPAALGVISELLGPGLVNHATLVVGDLGLTDLVEPLSGPEQVRPGRIRRPR